jgi:hypothetical protein
MREDAERIARRLHEVQEILSSPEVLGTRWTRLPEGERELRIAAVEELLRAEVIFPGPSLYGQT